MVYAVVFIAGVALGTAPLVIWYYDYLRRLQRERTRLEEWNEQLQRECARVRQESETLDAHKMTFQERLEAFEARPVQYDELVAENSGLKQDLFNLSIELKKTNRDHAAIEARQKEIAEKANELAQRYLDENVKWIGQKLTPKNFTTSRTRLVKVIERCREIGFDIPPEKEEHLLKDLKKDFEQAVRLEYQREEQARIRAQAREEEKVRREAEKHLQEVEREQAALQAALDQALQQTKDEHSAEVEALRAKLKEAEEKAQRAKSQAEMTKAGHVYIISNIGSFGEGVYKIGMTRRRDPSDRVKELGDASVPFPFDVHMEIPCDDAPSLENALHRAFHDRRVNRVNFRKEFFRVNLDAIREVVEAHHGEVDYVADPEALEYGESLSMTDEDYQFVEETVQSVWDDEDATDIDG